MSYESKLLFFLFQKLDYREKENSGKKKLFWILIVYLFSNTLLSYNFFLAFDERSYIILTLTSNLFLVIIIVLADFDNLFLANKSYEILNVLPIDSSQLFFSKFLSAVIFLLLFILAAAIPQVIFFYMIVQNFINTIAYILTNLLFCYSSIGAFILIYIFVLNYFTAKATIILIIIQILFFIFIFYLTTLSSQIASLSKVIPFKENILKYKILEYFPQTFFSNSVYNPFNFLFCLIITVIIFYFLYSITSKSYISLIQKVNSLNRKRLKKTKFKFTFLNKIINKAIFLNNYEIASFNLIKYQLQNSRFLRIKYIPFAFIPIVLVVFGIISDIPQLLFFNKPLNNQPFIKTAFFVLSPSITFTLLMCSRLLISNTKILDENTSNTGWIYHSLPIKNKRLFIQGSNKFIYLYFILPGIITILILTWIKSDFLTALLNILFIACAIYLINSIILIFDKTYPFTLESTKFNSASKFIDVLGAIFIGVFLFLIQIFVFQNIIFVIVSIMGFIMTSWLLKRIK